MQDDYCQAGMGTGCKPLVCYALYVSGTYACSRTMSDILGSHFGYLGQVTRKPNIRVIFLFIKSRRAQ